MPRVGVVLSGCGFLDGAEIHEATLTLLHLDAAGAAIRCMAPATAEFEVVDHCRREPAGERRGVLAEAGRIARGEIVPLAGVDAGSLDAAIFPGGFGAARNLCDWAVKGPECDVDADVRRLITALYAAGKPMGFICIAPVLAARVLGGHGVTITIGNDRATAAGIEATGARHRDCPVDEAVVDAEHRIVSTPAYMLGPSISHIDKGIGRLVAEVLRLAR